MICNRFVKSIKRGRMIWMFRDLVELSKKNVMAEPQRRFGQQVQYKFSCRRWIITKGVHYQRRIVVSKLNTSSSGIVVFYFLTNGTMIFNCFPSFLFSTKFEIGSKLELWKKGSSKIFKHQEWSWKEPFVCFVILGFFSSCSEEQNCLFNFVLTNRKVAVILLQ